MTKIIKKENYIKVLLSFLLSLVIMVTRPLYLNMYQSIILGTMILIILWWATNWVHKDVSSIILIATFIVFGQTPLHKVLFFPLSDNFILVISSFLLSQGIVNSKVADKFSNFVLAKYCYNSVRLVIMSFILSILLIFVIPQPFPRIILLSSIYTNFLNNSGVSEENKKVLIFSIFVASTVTSLMFLNGDVIINYAAMRFGGINLTYAQWAKYMALPTLLTSIIIAVFFILTFRNNLKDIFDNSENNESIELNDTGKKTLFITLILIVFWTTESYHGISAAKVALIGTLLMFSMNVISLKDLKVINISLIIFLTAVFSIGKVLVENGTAKLISESLMSLFPDEQSLFYLPFIVALIIVLHMVMGSFVTVISVLIPMLTTITSGTLSNTFVVLITTSAVCYQYLLPFHHVSIMIGYGNGYYENRHVLKIGGVLTIITIISVLFIYIPWWKFLKLL